MWITANPGYIYGHCRLAVILQLKLKPFRSIKSQWYSVTSKEWTDMYVRCWWLQAFLTAPKSQLNR